MSDTSKLTHLGGKSDYRYENPDKDILEVFENGHKDGPHVVGLECFEFTALCPMTGQPDFGKISIAYIPDELCVESKSLKLYLGAYRNEGSFHEDCVNKIADDIYAKIKPKYLRVYGDFNARGGIAIKPMALRKSESIDESEAELLVKNYDRLISGGQKEG